MLHTMLRAPRASAAAPCRAASTSRPLRVTVVAAAAAKDGKIKKGARAPSAYNLYMKQHYHRVAEELQRSNGNKPSLVECNARLRQQWDALPDKQKEPFAQESAKLREELVEAKKAAKGPTKPLSAWNIYHKTQFQTYKAKFPDASMVDITRMIGAEWKKLSDAQKQQYKSAAPAPAAAAAAPRATSPAPRTQAAPAPAAQTRAPSSSARAPAAPSRASSVPKRGTSTAR